MAYKNKKFKGCVVMDSAKEFWHRVLSNLELTVSAANFDVWINTLEFVNITDSKLVLMASNEKIKTFVYDRFKAIILAAVIDENPLITDIIMIDPTEAEVFLTKGDTFVIDEKPNITQPPMMVINPKYNFENFVVGESNKFLFSAANAVANEPGTRYNPLFIYGGAGLGKTHIMHSIGNEIKTLYPHLKVLYVSSERFLNEFLDSIRATKGKSAEFRDKYRGTDVLMIDDIQGIVGKDRTQEELFNTFNELYQLGKQIVFSSDKPPKEIPGLEDRLRSRFEWGLIADVQPPDLETRIAILQKKAQIEKYIVPLEVLALIAEKMLSGNIREMESLLNKVILMSKLYEKKADTDMVIEALKDYNVKNEEALTADTIIDCTCKYFSLDPMDLFSRKKTKEVAEPRQICFYLMTELLTLPLAAIGEKMGGRDHTTVMHARDKIAAGMTQNLKTKIAVQDIKDMIMRK